MAIKRASARLPAVPTAVCLLLLGGAGVWLARDWFGTKIGQTGNWASDESPLITYRSTRPGVGYVGDEACAQCHPHEAENYARHPMGRSLGPIATSRTNERYGPETQNPFRKDGIRFDVEHRNQETWHRVQRLDAAGSVLAESKYTIDYVIGSGTRGYSYLVERDGHVFQSPISWFAQKGIWDLTPGFQVIEHFERPAPAECLFCHCNQASAMPHSRSRYQEPVFRGHAIGCERCHGPGELHVREREDGREFEGPDDTIVHPGRLTGPARDSVCEQCHLQGEARIVRRGRQIFDFRPGLPLQDFLSVFLRTPEFEDERRTLNHSIQMAQSRCYNASGGRMGCISCHDPHQSPAEVDRKAYFRDRCIACHRDSGCALPVDVRRRQEPLDACTSCHMPRQSSSNISHTAVTDHRIHRRPTVPSEASRPRRLQSGEIPLWRFHRDARGAKGPEYERDLGLALAELGRDVADIARHVTPLAMPLLQSAVVSDPSDVPAWEALGFSAWRIGRKTDAARALARALELAPDREIALTYAAVLAAEMGDYAASVRHWQKAVRVNPYSAQYSFELAQALANVKRWPEALTSCRKARDINPIRDDIRTLLILCFLRTGDQRAASKELDTLIAMRPQDDLVLKRWFVEQQRSP